MSIARVAQIKDQKNNDQSKAKVACTDTHFASFTSKYIGRERSKLRPQLIYSIILENVIWLPITLKFSEAGQKIKRTELGYSALTIVFSFVIVYLSFIIPDPMM